ncbi:MAG: PKD domain-containing protein [Bacteroidia bacterium]|nr:PKD domain-containing protein [Bacteroidia bacterium]
MTVVATTFFTACNLDKVDPLAPQAAFTVANDGCKAPCTLTFTNTSQNAASYLWDFGDGNTSTGDSPTHQYESAGTYTVTLTANGAGGDSDEFEDMVTVLPGTFNISLGNVGTTDVAFAVLAGDTEIYVAGYERNAADINEIVVYKLDMEGNVLGKAELNNTVSCYGEDAGALAFTSNGDLILMVGMLGYDVLVSRISTGSMTPVNTKSYNGIDPRSMTVTSNDDIVIAGQRLSSTFNGGILVLDYVGRLLRLNSNLDSLWMRPFFDDQEGTLNTVVQTSNFQLLTVGSVIPIGGGARNGIVFSANSTGTSVTKSQELGDVPSSETARDLLIKSNGDVIVAGYTSTNSTNYNPYFVKLNSSLTILDSKINFAPLSSSNELIFDMEEIPGGGYIAAGYIWVDGLEADLFLLKVDQNFNYVWHKTFGGAFRDYGFEVEVLPDGGFTIVGYTRINESDTDMIIVKTDASGNVD